MESASRNRRELAAAKEFGFDCLCYCAKSAGAIQENYPDFTLCVSSGKSPTPKQPKPQRLLINLKNLFIYAKELRQIGADVVSCHNVGAFAVAYASYLFSKKKPKFIYDSHEFELRKKKRNAVSYFFIKHLEGFLIKRAALTVMVNESIADEVAKLHHYEYPRAVVRSTPDFWQLDPAVSERMHREFCEKLGIPEDSFIIWKRNKKEDLLYTISSLWSLAFWAQQTVA